MITSQAAKVEAETRQTSASESKNAFFIFFSSLKLAVFGPFECALAGAGWKSLSDSSKPPNAQNSAFHQSTPPRANLSSPYLQCERARAEKQVFLPGNDPKSEARNSKSETIPNDRKGKSKTNALVRRFGALPVLNLPFVFPPRRDPVRRRDVLRASNFEFWRIVR